jgi:hypothetical protein
MKKSNSISLSIAAILLSMSLIASAQDDSRSRQYVAVDCLQSTHMKDAGLPSDDWLAAHQELVDQGRQISWALYRVLFGDRSQCEFYAVTTYVGDEQLNRDLAGEDDFHTVQSLATELWVVVDRTEIKMHRYAVVNLMHAPDPDAYQRMESRVFKPGHQSLLENGHRAGWAMYELVAPLGTSIPYNFSTVDFSNSLSPVPMAEAMMLANPDRDIEEMHELLQLREQVSSQTLQLLVATEKPKKPVTK